MNSAAAAAGGGRVSTFIVVDNGRTNPSITASGGGRNSDGASQPRRRRVYSDGSALVAYNESSASEVAPAIDHVTLKMKRHSLDDKRHSGPRNFDLLVYPHAPVFQNEGSIASSSAACRSADSEGRDSSDSRRRHVSFSYSPDRATEQGKQQHRVTSSSSGSGSADRRRHSNESDVTPLPASDQCRQQHPRRSSISHIQQFRQQQRQRRHSLQDSSAPGSVHQSVLRSAAAVAVAPTQVEDQTSTTETQAGRRMSDSKLLPRDVELFRERSLSDCNRAAQRRVMARLVLRSPRAMGQLEAWGAVDRVPQPRRLERLMAQQIAENEPHQTRNDIVEPTIAHSRSLPLNGAVDLPRSSGDAIGKTPSENRRLSDAEGRKRSSPVDWKLTSAELHSSVEPREPCSVAAPVVGGGSTCKPKPLLGRKAKELLLFGSEGVA